MPHRKYTLEEVAEYLHLKPAEIEILVKRREIPFEEAGGRVIFRKIDLDAWASQRLLGGSAENLQTFHSASSAQAHDLSDTHAILPELMQVSFCHPEVASRTKASILRQMVTHADATGLLNYPGDLLRSLEERESLASTALAGGLALLHPKNHEPYMFQDSFIVLGRTTQQIPFGAPDGRLTGLFFLICCQDDHIHLHVLARICMMCYHTPVIMELEEAQTAEELYQALIHAEQEVIRQKVLKGKPGNP